MANGRIVWVHGDALNPQSVPLKANPGAPAVFVFDERLIKEYKLSLKRLVFFYECLLEMPVSIRKGKVAEEVLRFAREHKAERVDTSFSPSPLFAHLADTISESVEELRVFHSPPFVEDGPYDLKRFSRYWRKARRSALRPTDSTR